MPKHQESPAAVTLHGPSQSLLPRERREDTSSRTGFQALGGRVVVWRATTPIERAILDAEKTAVTQ